MEGVFRAFGVRHISRSRLLPTASPLHMVATFTAAIYKPHHHHLAIDRREASGPSAAAITGGFKNIHRWIMIARRRTVFAVVALLLSGLSSVEAFSCNIQSQSVEYDLHPLSGTRHASKNTETPPTTSEAKVSMRLCHEIERLEGVPDEDQVRHSFLKPSLMFQRLDLSSLGLLCQNHWSLPCT